MSIDINSVKYKIIKTLGEGSFGKVYQVMNGKYYAIKTISIINKSPEEIELTKKEALILSNINNKYIVKYYDSCQDKEYFKILMEYCEGTDLRKFINNYKNKKELIDEKIVYKIILQLCIGLNYIHKKKLIHRDLKPENIFINSNNDVKIGDFGIARQLGLNTNYVKTFAGTFYYMAPEEWTNQKYNYKVDIWALGCIIYELLTLNICFDGAILELINKINKEPHGKINSNKYNYKWQNLIDLLLKKNYKERPDINYICNYLKNELFNNNFKNNEIIITVKAKKDDINEDINFLTAANELNESNTELFINNKKYKYQQSFKPEKEGIYQIKLKLNCYVSDCSYMFCDCLRIIKLDLSSFDTRNVTKMKGMFYSCYYLTELNLSFFDTKKVTDMSKMFYYCYKLKEIDLSFFDTQNVKNMSEMFCFCNTLNNLDLFPLDTKIVTDMCGIFSSCSCLTSLDLSPLDTKNVTDMSYMFYSCSSLKTLDLSLLDTKNVTDMRGMFAECYGLKTLDLKTFNTHNVRNMNMMFHRCFNLTEINVSSFDTRNVNDMGAIFKSCESLTFLNVSNFYINNETEMYYFISNCKSLKNLDLFIFDNLKDQIETFRFLYEPKSIFLDNLREIKIKKNCIDKIAKEKISNDIKLIII